eukprot:TRINITY_DN2042_c0_g1_i6.p1 TRINITY_DN2042_c0_g1~~TRINITY_DN2042_c0_g1_i6.p1  ORF type:complete len:519 (+),score=31.80 TRINITY_DN2042_c0_g1_i6:168-1724(+)
MRCCIFEYHLYVRVRALLTVCFGALVFHAHGLYDPVRRIESARLYGNIDAYAYYFVDLLVGTPPQRASVILDTGSGLCGFPCAKCPHCGKHIDPLFDISKSKSGKWVGCGRPDCSGSCKQGHCSYYQGYQEGSSISGYWFEDLVSLGDAIQQNPPIRAQMGCHQNENKLFYTQKANGIFGIQGTKTMLRNLFADSQHVQSSIFSICLAEWGGRLTVGGHNESYHTGKIQYVNFPGSSYVVPLSSMVVNGQTIRNFKRTMLDSGTTYTYMGRAAYDALRKGIENYCSSHKGCGATKRGSCWTVLDRKVGVDLFPDVTVYFNSVSTTWRAKGYLYRQSTGNSWCYAFQDDGPGAGTVLGASWMQHKEIIFDLKSNRIGIVPAKCPEHKDRPQHTPHRMSLPTTTSQPAGPPSKGGVPLAKALIKAAKILKEPQQASQELFHNRLQAPSLLSIASIALLLGFCTLSAVCCRRRLCRGQFVDLDKKVDHCDSTLPREPVGNLEKNDIETHTPSFHIDSGPLE